MPSGRTHDIVTLLFVPPTCALVWWATGSWKLCAIVGAATLFGGLMFGPDLDIQSRQYTRWGPLRLVWFPYKVVFSHRSRLTHGIILGTLIRVIYFTGALVLIALFAAYVHARFFSGDPAPSPAEIALAWQAIQTNLSLYGVDRNVLIATFAGLWWGAAIHTFTDVFWSMLRKATEIF